MSWFSIIFKTKRKEQHSVIATNACYDILPYIFQYLELYDLLKAARVCVVWRDSATHPFLWRTVRLTNCRITNFKGLANALQKRGTQNLDFRNAFTTNEEWESFREAVLLRANSFVKVELGPCHFTDVKAVVKSCPQLKVLRAGSVTNNGSQFFGFKAIGPLSRQLEELRLETAFPLFASRNYNLDFTPLQNLQHLRDLSLEMLQDLRPKNIDILRTLTKLEGLRLGLHVSLDQNFITDVLLKLKQLKRLRLGWYIQYDVCAILEAVSKLENLSRLELEQVVLEKKNIKSFTFYLGCCKNLKQLFFVPYCSFNDFYLNELLEGVGRLSTTLKHFAIGIKKKMPESNNPPIPIPLEVDILWDFKHESNEESKSSLYSRLLEAIEENLDQQKEKLFKINSRITQLNANNSYDQTQAWLNLQKLLLTLLPESRVTIIWIPDGRLSCWKLKQPQTLFD